MSEAIHIDYKEDNPFSKLNQCKYRSASKIEDINKSCCGKNKIVLGFKCLERDIFPLNNNICDKCTIFEIKKSD